MAVPLVLRFYWWRFNGAGYAIGTMAGMFGAIIQRCLWHDMTEVNQFIFGLSVGLGGCMIGTFLFKPSSREVLEHFYRTTRPFGLWKPLRHILSDSQQKQLKSETFYNVLSVPFATCWMLTIYLLPMQLMIKQFKAAAVTSIVLAISLAGLYKFWYKKLPQSNSLPAPFDIRNGN